MKVDYNSESNTIRAAVYAAFPGLVLSVLAKWREGEQFKFRLSLDNANVKPGMVFDYSGGVLAFAPAPGPDCFSEDLRTREAARTRFLHKQAKHNQYSKGAGSRYAREHDDAIAGLYATAMPELVDVLCSLVLDTEFGEMTHADFCDSCGYNIDSIKDRETWETCARQGREFLRVIGGRANFDKLANLVGNF